MRDAVRHRGPDDYGDLLSNSAGIGNVRLSIIDLAGGRQPISNEDHTRHIVFNGEIFNFQQLRDRLPNHQFKTHSDTESILHAWEEWGSEGVRELSGMFAFCIWDQVRGRFFLARDRIGIKPLYYVLTKTFFAFASEIKALLAAGLVKPEVNPLALRDYLTHKYQVEDHTLFAGIKKMQPGTWMEINENGSSQNGYFWSYSKMTTAMDEKDAARSLEKIIQDSVADQMIADVPVGCYLSGGLDSSIVLHEMVKHAGTPPQCFTVAYDDVDGEINEKDLAIAMARQVGAPHTVVTCSAADVFKWLPLLIYHLDEPISEPLTVPTHLLARAAAQKVKVVLTGEGADELFAGYSRFTSAHSLASLQNVPAALRSLAADLASRLLGPQTWYPRLLRTSLSPERFPDLQVLFSSQELTALCGSAEISTTVVHEGANDAAGLLESMMDFDAQHRLPEFILTRADKMTMAASLEMRPPLLDNRVIDFALTVPAELKLRNGMEKYVLRRAFESQLPASVVWRKKQAFAAPYSHWIEPLTKKYLSDSHIAQAGLLSGSEIRKLTDGHRFYRGRRHDKLWTLIVLEIWYRIFIDQTLTPFL